MKAKWQEPKFYQIFAKGDVKDNFLGFSPSSEDRTELRIQCDKENKWKGNELVISIIIPSYITRCYHTSLKSLTSNNSTLIQNRLDRK